VRRGAAAHQWFASQDACDWLGSASASSVAGLQAASAPRPLSALGEFPIGSTCGLPYALVALDSEAALDAIAVDPTAPPAAFQAQCGLPHGLALYFYVRTGEAAARTRMFCSEGGRWIEDVATGSAAGPLAAHLAPFQGTFVQGSTRRAHIEVKSSARAGPCCASPRARGPHYLGENLERGPTETDSEFLGWNGKDVFSSQ